MLFGAIELFLCCKGDREDDYAKEGGQMDTSLHCKDDRLSSTRQPVSEKEGTVITRTRCPLEPTSSLVSKLGWLPMK